MEPPGAPEPTPSRRLCAGSRQSLDAASFFDNTVENNSRGVSRDRAVMPKIVDAEAQRVAIRRAARDVFARRGVAAGLAQVADAAGMGRSSLYHYYGDRASLVRDLVRDLLAREEALFGAAATGDASPLARLDALAAGLPGLFAEWSAIGRLLLELRSGDARLFRSFFRRIRRGLAKLIAEGQQSGDVAPQLDADALAATLIGAIDGLLLQHLIDRSVWPDPRALGDTLAPLLRKLLAP
jgi:AcrR family transcriptional regulator